MPPAPLSPTIRYFPPGIRKCYWVPVIATYTAPTRGEINAGVDLSFEINAAVGWAIATTDTDVPDMGSRFTPQVPGRLNASGSTIDFFTSQNSVDVRTLLVNGTNGNIIWCWDGDVTGQRMDVFPVRVSTQQMDTVIDDPGKVTVAFSVTKVPAINVLIP